MNITQVSRLGQRLQGKIERITGVNFQGATYGFGNTDIAATSGNAIAFNQQWLKEASKRQVKGAIAHELGHVLQGANSSLTGVQQESYGDALRARLGLGAGGGYNSTQERQMRGLSDAEFQRLSQMAARGNIDRTWLKEASMAGTDGNGPKVGDGNRKRNTFANMLSKYQTDYTNKGGSGALPSLGPAATANYYNQLAGLYAGYQNQLIALKQQRVGARADFAAQKAQIQGQKISDLASVENAGIERGLAGSSAVSQDLAGVRGAASASVQAAQRAKMETVAATRIQGQQAGIDYFMGAQGLEAQKLAQQQELLAQQLQQNLIVSGQESQMDALKAIYNALLNSTGGAGGTSGGGYVYQKPKALADYYGVSLEDILGSHGRRT